MPLIYITVGIRGFCLGYTIASVIAFWGWQKGILFASAVLLLPNLFCIPATMAVAMSGIHFFKMMIKNKGLETIRIEAYRHSIFSLLLSTLFIVSSLIEAYISSNLLHIIAAFF